MLLGTARPQASGKGGKLYHEISHPVTARHADCSAGQWRLTEVEVSAARFVLCHAVRPQCQGVRDVQSPVIPHKDGRQDAVKGLLHLCLLAGLLLLGNTGILDCRQRQEYYGFCISGETVSSNKLCEFTMRKFRSYLPLYLVSPAPPC